MDVIDRVVGGLESVLPMEGPLAIPARAAIGAALGWLVMQAIRPDFAYTPDGTARKWAVMPDLYSGVDPETHLPFFVGPVAGAILLAGFI